MMNTFKTILKMLVAIESVLVIAGIVIVVLVTGIYTEIMPMIHAISAVNVLWFIFGAIVFIISLIILASNVERPAFWKDVVMIALLVVSALLFCAGIIAVIYQYSH